MPSSIALSALEGEKVAKTKWIQFCGTPCTNAMTKDRNRHTKRHTKIETDSETPSGKQTEII